MLEHQRLVRDFFSQALLMPRYSAASISLSVMRVARSSIGARCEGGIDLWPERSTRLVLICRFPGWASGAAAATPLADFLGNC